MRGCPVPCCIPRSMARVAWLFAVCLLCASSSLAFEREGDSSENEKEPSRERGGRFFNAFWTPYLQPRIGEGPSATAESSGSAEDTAVIVETRPWRDDGFFGFPVRQPWWKGPNVCNFRQEVDDSKEDNATVPFAFNFQSKQCQDTEDSFVCTTKIRTMNSSKTITDKYVCCHGFARGRNGRAGCVQVNLKDLVTTMKDLGASKFVDLVEESKMADELNKGNVTVFVPTNIAVKDFEHTNEVSSPYDGQAAIRAHTVAGSLRTGDMADEMVLQTVDGRSSIRINEFYNPAKLMTANCVPIVSANNPATSGMVHVVDETLPSPNRTLYEIVSEDPRFSTLRSLLSMGDLEETLKNPQGHYTLLAPSDDAFAKVHKDTLAKWKSGDACIAKLLRGHLLNHVICTTAVPGSARVRSVNGDPVTLSRDGDRLLADGSPVSARDLMATNGVLHVLDHILMSQDSKPLMQTLRDAKMDDLVHLIEAANLTESFEALDNFTFFAPSEEALKEVSLTEWEDMKSDRLADTLRYHTVPGQMLSPRGFFNNMLVGTALGEERPIRLNIFPRLFSFERPTVTAQCARLLSASSPVCGGAVYVVDKVMKPPAGNVLELIESDGELSTFARLVRESGLSEQLRSNAGPFTVLAPTDSAFSRLPRGTLDSLQPEQVQALVKQHVLPETACTSGVGHSGFLSRLEYRNLDGTAVPTQRSLRGNVYFGGARVSRPDLAARNGLVHHVARVLSMRTADEDTGFNFGFDLHPFFRSL
ncbi:transforming growth factor-beta-induced protein ig-h3 [Rhipicephalus sanguineus]|uniref:transforming growth factor-beta-induced protein ig-h3 n=1 Tax=Rhipicephalus sanguineus TaxID=34632 RepID=UPI00189410C7|nr:transforming growth factor-beta-induced protein ig-h3 [Rhipicephalus sanguineus]